MELPLSRAVVPELEFVNSTGSTNADLAVRSDAAEFTVLVTTDQTAGRGRLGRAWVAPPGTALAVSVLLRPATPRPEALGWVPLLAGVAMARAVGGLLPDREVLVKWPNDVLVDGLKISGILTELVGDARAVVVGAGLNLTMGADELPTATATSLTLQGAPADGILDRALAGYLRRLRDLWRAFVDSGMDAESSGLRESVRRASGTLGRPVRVELPGGRTLRGIGGDVDAQGRLVVRDDDGRPVPVAAGDVVHASLS